MSDVSPSLYVGVRHTENGPDFSKALRIETTLKNESSSRMEQIFHDAQARGLDKSKLDELTQALTNTHGAIETKATLNRKSIELKVSADDLLVLARRYKKEQMRQSEKGELLHYHQMTLGNFESAISDGKLLSYNKLKSIDKASFSSGTRPDVVLMTRDHFDAVGAMTEPGLRNSATSVGAHGGVVLVFDQAIIDKPEYDTLGTYPNLPEITFDTLNAVVAETELEKQKVEKIVEKMERKPIVYTRKEWTAMKHVSTKRT